MEKAPNYLSKKAKDFFNNILELYEFEDHHIKTLILAADCLDRIEEARAYVKKEGPYYKDRFRQPRPNPALKTIEQNKIIFARLIRELNLDIDEPNREIGRPPRQY